MKLSNIDEVIALRNTRDKLVSLKEAVKSGAIDAQVSYTGVKTNVFSLISVDRVRLAMLDDCEKDIRAIDISLGTYGVTI